MNKVIMIGNLTKQPELRYTPNEKAVATFTIAVNTGFGENKKTDYFNIVVWGKPAENSANFLDKGSKVAITGRLQNRSYESKDGTKKYITEIVAEEVEFLSSKQSSSNNNNIESGNQFDGLEQAEDDVELPW